MSIAWDILNTAVEQHRQGRLDEAERLYQSAIRADSNLPQAPYFLGVLSAQLNRVPIAVDYLQQAIALDLQFVPAYLELASLYSRLGESKQAVSLLERCVERNPNDADALNNLGNLYRDTQRPALAEQVYRQALLIRPAFPEALCNLGLSLHEQAKPNEAIGFFQQAARYAPQAAAIHHNLGNSQRAIGQLEAAVVSFRTALACDPKLVESLNNLGIALNELGETEQAVDAFRRALAVAPDYLDVYNNLGCVLKRRFEYSAATELFREWIRHRPDSLEGHINLLSTLLDEMKFSEAVQQAEVAYKLDPEHAASVLVNAKQLVCDWTNLEPLCKQVVQTVEADKYDDLRHAVPPFLFCGLAIPTTPQQQQLCARAWRRGMIATQLPIQSKTSLPSDRIDRRIRVGYISADFRIHAVAYMLPELFESHDRSEFEVYGYSLCPDDQSPIRKRLIAGFDHFRDFTNLSDRAAAQRIADDEIDILVDLQGYTNLCRTEILAMRPAPIQASYLGYPGTMGAEFIDYILADEYVIPNDQRAFYDEKIVYLPGCYQVNDSRHIVAEHRPTRSECSLPEDAFVFCSFNNSYKLTPFMFDVWMRLLKRIPNSVLWLTPQESTAHANLCREAESRGVALERIVFAEKLPLDKHLARQPLADLFLDCFPYNGHATSSIALRMGVPIITLSGVSMASRVAGSLLRTLNLHELIVNDFETYEQLAIRLATDLPFYTSLRQRLETELKTSELFNGRSFTRRLEKAYQEMNRLHQPENHHEM